MAVQAGQPCIGHPHSAGDHRSVNQQVLQPLCLTARATSGTPRHEPVGPRSSIDHQQPSWQHCNTFIQLPVGVQSLYGMPVQSHTAKRNLVQDFLAASSCPVKLALNSQGLPLINLPSSRYLYDICTAIKCILQDLHRVHTMLGLGTIAMMP